MSYVARIEHLKVTHQMLDKRISELEKSPHKDEDISSLKKKRLRIKDEIVKLTVRNAKEQQNETPISG